MKRLYYVVMVLICVFILQIQAQTNLTAVSFTPPRNALNIAKNTMISVKFDSDINPTTLTNSTIRINGSLSGLYPCTFNYNSGTRTATITPNSQFKVGEIVIVTLTRGIKITNGDSLASSYSWSFTVKTNVSSWFYQLSSTIDMGNSSSPHSVIATDLDGNGTMDLAIANYGVGSVAILKNDGSGTLTQSSSATVGSNPNTVITADFDADGDMDLAVTNNGSGTISILKNNGNGKFSQISTVTVGSRPIAMIAVDVDGDGAMDIAVVNNFSHTVSILKNDGTGTFTLSSTVPVGIYPSSVTAADVDNDGKMDLIVTNSQSNSVSILLNAGNGTFTQSSTVNVGSIPWNVTAADLNGDGNIDLAVTNNSAGTVSILKNNGSGMFTQSSTINLGGNTSSVTAVHVDGDGDMDIVVGNNTLNTLTFLTNNGSGLFTSNLVVPIGSYPCSIAAVDLKGDGKIEFAVANGISNDVSILKNCSQITPTQITFQKTYGGMRDDYTHTVINVPGGGYLAAGKSNSCISSDFDISLFKTDSTGKLLWTKNLGTINNEYAGDMVVTNDGGTLISGLIQTQGQGSDILIIRTDANGNVVWGKTYGSTGDDCANSVYLLADGDYLIVGVTTSYGVGGWDVFLMKIDGDGNVRWFKTYGTSTTDFGIRILEETDGSLVVSGFTYNPGIGTHDMILIKTDNQGNLLWSTKYETPLEGGGFNLRKTSEGNYLVVTDQHQNAQSSNSDMVVYLIDTSGTMLWAKTYGSQGSYWDGCWGTATLENGGFVIAGDWGGTARFTNSKCFIMKIDSAGNPVWCNTYGNSGTSYASNLIKTDDGGFLLGGSTNSSEAGGYDCYLVKTNADGMSGSDGISVQPVVGNASINVSNLSLAVSTYSIEGQACQFTREGPACFGTNRSPIANAGPDQTVDIGTQAVFDGSASFDPDGDSLTYTWKAGKTVLGVGIQLAVTLPVGIHKITLVVNDGKGGEGYDNMLVTVKSNSPLSIKDVPNDNGKKVFLKWITNGSPIDSGVTNFSIYRYDEQNWTYLNDIPVLSDSVYQVIAPTIFDSTKSKGVYWSVFRVIAHTANPAIYTILGPDSGYSVNNIPPRAPKQVKATRISNGRFMIQWNAPTKKDDDFKGYVIYRSLAPDFVPSIENRVACVQDTLFIDTVTCENTYCYKIVSEDISGNESEPLSISSATTGITVDNSNVPESFSLSQNYPNPFNPNTEIRFAIQKDDFVSLKVYDLMGREIAILVNEQLTPGTYSVAFNASRLASGIYIYRLIAGTNVMTKRMVLIK